MRATVTIDQIDAWLPQTQCTQCGYPRCRAYAEALAAGTAGIDQCPPGGNGTIHALAALLHLPTKPLNPRYGVHKSRTRAVIDETLCIGCRKCIDTCPVDAIVGARKLMHTVIAHECTGCELCLPPCPVDCIAMAPNHIGPARSASGSPQSEPDRASARTAPILQNSPLPQAGEGSGRGEVGEKLHFDRNEGEGWPEYAQAESDHWRRRTENRLQRLRLKRARRKKSSDGFPPAPGREQIRADIRAAIARVKARKSRRSGPDPSSA